MPVYKMPGKCPEDARGLPVTRITWLHNKPESDGTRNASLRTGSGRGVSRTTLLWLSYHSRTTLALLSYHSRTTPYHARTTPAPLPYHSRTSLAPHSIMACCALWDGLVANCGGPMDSCGLQVAPWNVVVSRWPHGESDFLGREIRPMRLQIR